MQERIDALLEYVRKEKTKEDIKEETITALSIEVGDKRESVDVLLKVVDLFKHLGGINEEDILEKIEKFVTFGVKRVFGPTFQFKVLMDIKGKDVKLDFLVKKDDNLISITDACGGGVSDVVSLLLQLFFVVMNKGKVAPLLILDTSLIHLSDEYIGRMSALLKEICYGLDIQIIFITHTMKYAEFADVHYMFTQKEGKTLVERIK